MGAGLLCAVGHSVSRHRCLARAWLRLPFPRLGILLLEHGGGLAQYCERQPVPVGGPLATVILAHGSPRQSWHQATEGSGNR